MDETKMTPEAKRMFDAVMAEVWTEWIADYLPALIMLDPEVIQ
jgi:hypothetical protein